MIDIEDVKRLKIGPHDRLVVQTSGMVTEEVASRIRGRMADWDPDLLGRVLVIDNTVQLLVVGPGKV